MSLLTEDVYVTHLESHGMSIHRLWKLSFSTFPVAGSVQPKQMVGVNNECACIKHRRLLTLLEGHNTSHCLRAAICGYILSFLCNSMNEVYPRTSLLSKYQ